MIKRRLAVLDLETDPFLYGRIPHPFLSGFYDGSKFVTIWDEQNCIDRTAAMLAKISDPLIIYAHNGGKFDWFYFLNYLTNRSNLRIINGRIVSAFIGNHEIRDSYAIMPFPLASYKKKEISIAKLERHARNKNRDEIIDYLRVDCKSLYELVVAFWDEFGDILTVGSAAISQLKNYHQFLSGDDTYDKRYREKFYFGGRVEVFTPGEIHHPVSVFDVNSMYPYVMANYSHPIGTSALHSNKITPNTTFVVTDGFSEGAFPIRSDDGGIYFPHTNGRFCVTIHEWRAAEETHTFKPTRVVETFDFRSQGCFDQFVTHFYESRLKAKQIGDRIHELFYKYILNSAYGKFAQNPAHYFEYTITAWNQPWPSAPWELHALSPGAYLLWRKPLDQLRYYNISTAASITGAARSILLRGLHHVDTASYCDTDSIIARGPNRLEVSDTDLGRWKIEANANSAVFAGKKIYALFDAQGNTIKKASKGAKLSGEEIRRIAKGETVTWRSQVPHFKLTGAHAFVERRIQKTV